jgi:predicted acetyltransferase
VKAFINVSQMTVSQMSVTETTASPQHKLQWLSEQALNWSGLPVVHVRPTVFLEGFFLTLIAESVRESDCKADRPATDGGVAARPSSNRSDLRYVV